MTTQDVSLAFLGYQELLIILLIVVVLFGAKKIPDLARGLGEGIRNFRAGIKEPPESTGPEDQGGSENEKLSGGSGQ
jgi:sec-independent protein translocase protein TatA